MKVLHFIWSASFGGIEKLVITLAQQQQKNERLKTSILIGNKKGNFLDLLKKTGLHCEYAGLKSGFDFSGKKFRQLQTLMKSFDIIHLHTFNPLVAYAAVKAKKKIVFTVHGNFGFGRQRKLSDYVLQMLCSRFIRKHVDFVTFNSEFSRNYARTFYRMKETKNEMLIYNAIPERHQTEVDLNENTDGFTSPGFVAGTASRFAGFKRIDRLIDAFAIFSKDKTDCSLLLVGDGIKMQELKMQVADLGIQDKTFFAGYRENIFSWLNKMDVCVFPSEKEPFGIVALEALSLGKPVLVFSDGGGITEIIKPLNHLNIADSITSLVERLNYYYTHRHSIDSEKSINQQYASRFSISANEQAYFQIYQLVMNENAG